MLLFFWHFPQNMLSYIANKGENMVEKIIKDKNIIKYISNRDDEYLILQYNVKNKRAWFKTNTMPKRKPICLSRVIDL